VAKPVITCANSLIPITGSIESILKKYTLETCSIVAEFALSLTSYSYQLLYNNRCIDAESSLWGQVGRGNVN
jgi:hypothetical protein